MHTALYYVDVHALSVFGLTSTHPSTLGREHAPCLLVGLQMTSTCRTQLLAVMMLLTHTAQVGWLAVGVHPT